MNLKTMKRLVLALMLTGIIQISGYAVDDVWGGMGLTEEALQKDSNYANTIFDKYTNYSETPAPKVNNGNYPADLTDSKNTVSASDTEKRTISNIEFYGLNSVSKDELLSKMQMKSGETYSRDMLQSDLKAIYETGFFTENMKAIPSKNDDGTVTVKIVVEENLPVIEPAPVEESAQVNVTDASFEEEPAAAPQPEPETTATEPAAPTAEITPAAEPVQEPQAAAKPAAPGKSNIVFEIKKETWIEVKTADKLYLSKVLYAGDSYTLPKAKGLIVSVGRFDGVETFIDGKPVDFLPKDRKMNIDLEAALAKVNRKL